MDEKHNPISLAKIIVENATYEGGDYDSYNNYYYDTLYTDTNGKYSLIIAKSAYLALTFSKQGYSDSFKAVEVYDNRVNIDIMLKKLSK